jgi:hypothetical protein
MRVCQFRHDGKWTSIAAARMPPHQEDLRFYFTGQSLAVKPPTQNDRTIIPWVA